MMLSRGIESDGDSMDLSDWSTSCNTDSEEDGGCAMPGLWQERARAEIAPATNLALPPKLPRKSSQRRPVSVIQAQAQQSAQQTTPRVPEQKKESTFTQNPTPLTDDDPESEWARNRRLSSLFSGLGFAGFPAPSTSVLRSASIASSLGNSLEVFARPLDADSESEHFHSADESLSDAWGLPLTGLSHSSSLASMASLLPTSDFVTAQFSAEFPEVKAIHQADISSQTFEIEQAMILSEQYLAQSDTPVKTAASTSNHSYSSSDGTSTTPTLCSDSTSNTGSGSSSDTCLTSWATDDFETGAASFREKEAECSPVCAPQFKFASPKAAPAVRNRTAPRLHTSKSTGAFKSDANATKHRSLAFATSKRRRSQTVAVSQPSVVALSPNLAPPVAAPVFRSQFSADAYEALLSQYGRQELKRQETIWELCQTERAFVSGLEQICEIFLNPLRTPQGRWIQGIPTSITRLFDWLDDIIHLHSELVAALDTIRKSRHNMVDRFADTFLAFVPHLEIHLPYLARFEKVAAHIDALVNDTNSDFGEFVRMQEALPECGSLPLTSFLLKPVQRIMKYPLFFKQLCETTPPEHTDHVSTLALLHSTDTMIRIMQEIKAREDEYEEIKTLQSTLKGLPPGFSLAQRDRRLLKRGSLKQLHISAQDRHFMDIQRSPVAEQKPVKTLRHSVSFQSASPATGLGILNSRLPPLDELSTDFQPQRPVKSVERVAPRLKAKESQIEVIVFSDIVIFATKQSEPLKMLRPSQRRSQEPTYRLLDDFGLCRILAVQDRSESLQDMPIELDLLPIARNEETQSISLCNASLATSVFVSPLGNSSPALSRGKPKTNLSAVDEHEHAGWLGAFETCHQSVLRSLSFPTSLNTFSTPNYKIRPSLSFLQDPSPDSNRVSYASVLDSGLPLPKSASQQDFMDRLSLSLVAKTSSDIESEREERGWWAMRFKKVRSDLQDAANARSTLYQLGQSHPAGLSGTSNLAPRPIRLHSLATRSALDLRQRL